MRTVGFIISPTRTWVHGPNSKVSAVGTGTIHEVQYETNGMYNRKNNESYVRLEPWSTRWSCGIITTRPCWLHVIVRGRIWAVSSWSWHIQIPGGLPCGTKPKFSKCLKSRSATSSDFIFGSDALSKWSTVDSPHLLKSPFPILIYPSDARHKAFLKCDSVRNWSLFETVFNIRGCSDPKYFSVRGKPKLTFSSNWADTDTLL